MPSSDLLRGRSILIVEDHDPSRILLLNYLGGLGCEVEGASGGNEALAKMGDRTFDLVLLDLRMDDLDGMEVLKRGRDGGLARSYIMMSAEGTISHAVEAIRLGATDFLVKPFELQQVLSMVQRALGSFASESAGGPDPRLLWRDQFAPGMVGEHDSLREIFLVLERIANTDCTVLVLGESGTGKELVARAIHESSGRSKKPFVPVNCGAIPETLIESELFGHAKGSFSGATQAREGRFAVADGGTLFLDEIGEMSLGVQVKFLRVLQEGEFVPVGETRPRKCDVRIIAATNKNLEKMAEEGSFREDLFYRLNLIPIHLPALRERREDVPLLSRHFLELFNERRGRSMTGFSDEAMGLMGAYDWPGNVRELENTVERMTLLHQGSGMLDADDLPPKIQQLARRSAAATRPTPAPSAPGGAVTDDDGAAVVAFPAGAGAPTPSAPGAGPTSEPGPVVALDAAAAHAPETPGSVSAASPRDFALPSEGLDLRKAVEEFEMGLIDQALERTGGNKNQASILLGMNRTTLVEKLRKRQRKAESAG